MQCYRPPLVLPFLPSLLTCINWSSDSDDVHTTAAKRPTNSGINPNWMRTKKGKTEKKKERKKEGKTEGKTEGKKEGKKESHLC